MMQPKKVVTFPSFHLALVLCLFGILAATFAVAQSTISTGSIQGTITDPSGAVVPGARVIISNTQTGQRIERTTTSAGTYNSGPLTSGLYNVRVEGKGFQTAEQKVSVQVGVTTPGNMKLTLGAENQVVEVSGEAVRVNTEQPTVQGVLTSQQIENLPVNGRNFLDLAQLEPGVQIQDAGNFDPTKNGFSSISFGGRAGRTARISLDGIDISDETVGTTTQNVSAGAINEFQISQSTLDLSTELTSSGAVNVVTKSGTNTVHGDGFFNFRDKDLGIANFPGGQDIPYQRNHMGGSLGGPIIPSKLFFFGNVERVKQDQKIAITPDDPFRGVIPSNYPSFFRDNTSLGRLDWNAPGNVKVFYRFNYHVANAAYAYGSTYQPFANRDQTPSHGAGVDFTTGKFSHSLRFGYFKFQNHIADVVLGNPSVFNPAGNVPVSIRIGPAGVAERFGPSRLAPQATFQANHQIKYDGSTTARAHIIRYGVDFNAIRGGGFASFYGITPEIRTSNNGTAQAFAATGPYPGGAGNPLNYKIRTILMGNGQGFFTENPAFNYPAGGQQDDRFAFYLGDTWKMFRNFTLTYGVRYSRDTGRQDSDLPPMTCDQIDPTLFSGAPLPCTGKSRILDQFGGNYGGSPRQPNNNWGPQIGFAWDPFGTGRTSIRAGAGVYYENAIFNNVLFDRPGRLPKGLFWGFATPCSAGIPTPSGPQDTFTYNGTTYDIATQICGQRVGDVMNIVAAMQKYYQQQTASAGATANPNFLGATLANGDNSTGNNFIAPNYKTPMSIQMNLGIQQELLPGMVLSADLLRNVGEHYLLAYDTNHIGDARFFNKTAAQNAIAATLSQYGVATIDQAIAAGAVIEDFANNGLDSGAWYLSGFPASYFGLDVNTGAAFPGINPLVGENTMLFPIGRSTYTALQMKLSHQSKNPFVPGLASAMYQISYSFSRFNTMTGDQDFVNTANDFARPGRYYGPSALDRTHQLSFGGAFAVKHGPQFSFITHLFSPLSVTPYMDEPDPTGAIFKTDITGDGTYQDVVGNVGVFGRDYKGANINNLINSFNSQYAGNLTPAGQVLVANGLFTPAQLAALGGVVPSVLPATPGQVNLGWLKTVDLRLEWPIKIGERFTIRPSIAAFNALNMANFDNPTNLLSGALATSEGGNTDTTPGTITGTNKAGHESTRVGTGTGVNTIGAPRQLEYGLRIVF